MGCLSWRLLFVIRRFTRHKHSSSIAQSLDGYLRTLYDYVCSGRLTRTHEEAIGPWTKSLSACSSFNSSPLFTGAIPSLYLYCGFITTSESWLDDIPHLCFRGLADSAAQYYFRRSGWPPALSQTLISQHGTRESSKFVEYVFTLQLTTFRLKYTLS